MILNKRKIKATANKPIYTSIPLTYTARLQAQYAKQLPVPSDLFYLGGRYSIKGIKEGNYLSGEHGFSLSKNLLGNCHYRILISTLVQMQTAPSCMQVLIKAMPMEKTLLIINAISWLERLV